VDGGEERHGYGGATIGTSQLSLGRQTDTPRVVRVLAEALRRRSGFGIARLPLDVEMRRYCTRLEGLRMLQSSMSMACVQDSGTTAA
jgi:hypothetical protein